jgi:outer membrane autotransporter protein
MLGSRFYPFASFSRITPYIEAGLGFSNNGFNRITYVDNNTPVSSGRVSSASLTDFAWKVGAGIEFALTEKLSVSAGYRYFDGGNVKSGKQVTDNVVGKFDYPGMKGSLRSHEAVVTLSLGL